MSSLICFGRDNPTYVAEYGKAFFQNQPVLIIETQDQEVHEFEFPAIGVLSRSKVLRNVLQSPDFLPIIHETPVIIMDNITGRVLNYAMQLLITGEVDVDNQEVREGVEDVFKMLEASGLVKCFQYANEEQEEDRWFEDEEEDAVDEQDDEFEDDDDEENNCIGEVKEEYGDITVKIELCPDIVEQLRSRQAAAKRNDRAIKVTKRVRVNMTQFKCNYCHYKFIAKEDLEKHTKEKHGGGGVKYQCTQCEHTVGTSMGLYHHFRVKHTYLMYSCDKCDFTSAVYQTVRIHKQSKHGKVIYRCDECPKKFKTSKYMYQHKKGVHGDMFYTCDRCQYKTTRKRELKKHIRNKH